MAWSEWWTVFGLGLTLGFKHALDSDHLVAVMSLVTETRSIRKSALFGATWGVGHTVTLLACGAVILLFRIQFPARLAMSFEFLVGIMLVILGVHVVIKAVREKVHIHWHTHGDITHIHFHSHKHGADHDHVHLRRPLLVGIVHGLAGSGALTLLVLSTLHSVIQGLLFILIFGLGSILGMMLTGAVISVPFLWTQRLTRVHRVVQSLAGLLSIGLGIVIMLEIIAAFSAA